MERFLREKQVELWGMSRSQVKHAVRVYLKWVKDQREGQMALPFDDPGAIYDGGD